MEVDDEAEATNPAVALVGELLEYICLDWLSMHLSTFFDKEKLDKSKLRQYKRSDIPGILLQNRFLELFSRPIDRRAPFLKTESKSQDPQEGELVSFYLLEAGAMYHRFELTLPRQSKLTKTKRHGFEIVNPLISLNIEPKFTAFHTNIPGPFLKYYIGYKEDTLNISPFVIKIRICYQMSWRGIFVKTGWNYHRWAESFCRVLEERVDEEHFFRSIGWNTVDAVLRCTSVRQAIQAKNLGKAPDHPPEEKVN